MLLNWAGSIRWDALFNVILIETHNQCTRTCWFCKFGQERQDPHTLQMNWQTIERIVGNIAKRPNLLRQAKLMGGRALGS
jgi:2-iminoacetate synthase ThiH